MVNANMILHAHGNARAWPASIATLQVLPAPESRGPRHKPVPHLEFVTVLKAALAARHLAVTREQYALNRTGQRFFFILHLAAESGHHGELVRPGMGFAIGGRAANDLTASLRLVAGENVFVCDNLALSGDAIVLARKHTTGLRLEAEVERGVTRYLEAQANHVRRIDAAQGLELSDDQAKLLIFDTFADAILPQRMFHNVVENYFQVEDLAERPDCEPRTLWGLANAHTREARHMGAATGLKASMRLGRLLDVDYIKARLDVVRPRLD